MGLDMYLYAERYIGGWQHADEKQRDTFQKVTALANLPTTDESPSVEVKATVGYWRKANQIHHWFVTHVQDGTDDCRSYHVERDTLRELREVCQKVLALPCESTTVTYNQLGPAGLETAREEGRMLSERATAEAEGLLPTQAGFFFGGTEYGEWYLRDIEGTVTILDRALALDEGIEFSYRSSW